MNSEAERVVSCLERAFPEMNLRKGLGTGNKFLKDYNLEQSSMIKENMGKKFEISSDCYKAAMKELENTFRYGSIRGMLMRFREDGERFYGDEFCSSEWLVKNRCGVPSYRVFLRDGGVYYTSFAWDMKKIYELSKEKDDLLLTCDIVTREAVPYPDDLKIDPMCQMVIGFERTSSKLDELFTNTFCRYPDFSEEITKDGKEIYHQTPFDFSEETWRDVVQDSKPTVRLFYYEDKKLRKIPLQADGSLLR